ncbi:MAG: hypothetical protein AAF327_19600 [Cyanobacteria bacterium P01_A01_bin.37]
MSDLKLRNRSAMLVPGYWCQDVSASDITGQGLGRSPTPLANSFKFEPVTSAVKQHPPSSNIRRHVTSTVTSHPPPKANKRSRLTQTHRHLVTSR